MQAGLALPEVVLSSLALADVLDNRDSISLAIVPGERRRDPDPDGSAALAEIALLEAVAWDVACEEARKQRLLARQVVRVRYFCGCLAQ